MSNSFLSGYKGLGGLADQLIREQQRASWQNAFAVVSTNVSAGQQIRITAPETPKPKTFRDELQADVNKWLGGIL